MDLWLSELAGAEAMSDDVSAEDAIYLERLRDELVYEAIAGLSPTARVGVIDRAMADFTPPDEA